MSVFQYCLSTAGSYCSKLYCLGTSSDYITLRREDNPIEHSLFKTLTMATEYFPPNIACEPVAQNINMIVTYRNNAIHFYNQPEFAIVIFRLPTSIINYRDIFKETLGVDIAAEMTIVLLPLWFILPQTRSSSYRKPRRTLRKVERLTSYEKFRRPL